MVRDGAARLLTMRVENLPEKDPHPEETAEGGRLEGLLQKDCSPSLFLHMR
jgi:hypothetical protein